MGGAWDPLGSDGDAGGTGFGTCGCGLSSALRAGHGSPPQHRVLGWEMQPPTLHAVHGADQGTGTQDPRGAGAARLGRAPCAGRDGDRGLAPLYSVGRVETPWCCQPQPSPSGHRVRRLRMLRSPAPSFVLAGAGERSRFNWQLCLWPACYEKVFCLPLQVTLNMFSLLI